MYPMLEDPPISGQKFMVLNIVGKNTNQKAEGTFVKVKYVCETEEEARQFAIRSRDKEPYLDHFVALTGRFIPIDVNPDDIPDQEYTNAHLTELMKQHRLEHQKADQLFQKYVQDNLDRHEKEREQGIVPKETVTPMSVYFKIKQLEATIAKRQAELDNLYIKFAEYSQEDQDIAKGYEYPQVDIVPFAFKEITSVDGAE